MINRNFDASIQTEVERLLDAARKETGLDDFGDGFAGIHFYEGLAWLLKSTREVPFSAVGLMGFGSTIHRQLVNRLRFHRDLKEHPEILAEDVSDPILILGMPRTGTTKLSRMLSVDPQFQSQAFWRLLNPAPFPDSRPDQLDPRIEAARQMITAIKATDPDAFAAHSFAAEDADEDNHLFLMTYAQVICWLQSPAPEYFEYLRELPRAPPYNYVKAILQYLQWQDGGRRGRRWVGKNPVTMGSIDAFLEAHPRSTFVYCHRDFNEIIVSLCRLFETLYAPVHTQVDLRKIGRDVLMFWPTELSRFDASRKRLGSSLKLIEIPFQQIVDDSIGAIQNVYEFAGITLSDEGRRSMLEWEARNSEVKKYEKQTYNLERYGLTQRKIERAFGSLPTRATA